ncbi:MAG: noncanonical pyrimidine nucleotidase, YjjG family [Allomuricauda sp.]|nr:MAG: noncanonical pyrimidine nucleotidase, YjjG family [Allomuricauda sp.]
MFKSLVTDVFFDLDHTLWDFEKNSALTFKKILIDHKVNVKLDDFLTAYVPINHAYWKLYRDEKVTKQELRYQRLRKTFDEVGVKVNDLIIDQLSDAYIEHLSSYNNLFPYAQEILGYLSPNYRLHIITNGFQEIQDKKLKKSNIYGYFDQIVNSEQAGVKKPHPQIFEMALQKAKCEAKSALMIGDNLEADIIGARAIGFHALHFNSNQEPAHEICPMITSLDEIKSFL